MCTQYDSRGQVYLEQPGQSGGLAPCLLSLAELPAHHSQLCGRLNTCQRFYVHRQGDVQEVFTTSQYLFLKVLQASFYAASSLHPSCTTEQQGTCSAGTLILSEAMHKSFVHQRVAFTVFIGHATGLVTYISSWCNLPAANCCNTSNQQVRAASSQ